MAGQPCMTAPGPNGPKYVVMHGVCPVLPPRRSICNSGCSSKNTYVRACMLRAWRGLMELALMESARALKKNMCGMPTYLDDLFQVLKYYIGIIIFSTSDIPVLIFTLTSSNSPLPLSVPNTTGIEGAWKKYSV